MRKTYKGGDEVKKGFYGSTRRWAIEMVKTTGDPLPGPADEKYYRLPTVVMLAAAPLIGFAFVIFLPLIGFVLLGVFAWRTLTGKPPEAEEVKKAA